MDTITVHTSLHSDDTLEIIDQYGDVRIIPTCEYQDFIADLDASVRVDTSSVYAS